MNTDTISADERQQIANGAQPRCRLNCLHVSFMNFAEILSIPFDDLGHIEMRDR